MTAPLPMGMPIMLDADAKQLAPDVLFGGSPARVLRLSTTGMRALAELRAGAVRTAAGAALARKLTDAGVAHPRPAPQPLEVTVAIPVRDRVAELGRCLAAVGTAHPVVVVDDGSRDPSAVRAVCAAHGARLIALPHNGGPGAARNAALRVIETEFVAFLDSDCEPPRHWIVALGGHFADPLVAAVAPRILERTPGRSPLDLGDRPARVAPRTRVAYVPAAALIARRCALGSGFDRTLRYGEDVDLIWRLIESGWRVRYDPSVQVAHRNPESVRVLIARRFRYGTSAAPLTRRHPGSVAPLVLQPGPALTVAALLARRPVLAALAFTSATALLARRLSAAGLPARGLARAMAGGVGQTWLGAGRWAGQFAAPAVLSVTVRPGGPDARTRWGRRAAALSLLAGPPVAEWLRTRPPGGLPRYVVAQLADQAAYGAGVYAGCVHDRMIRPLLPEVSMRPIEGLSRDRR